MFDGIHFFEYDGIYLTNNNLSKEVAAQKNITEDTRTALFAEAQEQIKNHFVIDGRMQLLFPFPVSEKDKEHYFYPQIFCVCHSGASYYTRRKDYDSYEILYTYEGSGILEYEGKKYYLRKGDGFFLDCRKPHYYYTDGTHWLHSDLHFNGSIASELFQEYASDNNVTFHEQDEKYQTLLETLVRIWDTFQSYKQLQFSNYISEIIAHLLIDKDIKKSGGTMPDTFTYLIKYIEHNFAHNLTLDYLADFASMSKYHLCREFKKYTGMTPIQFVIYTRIENAKFLLKHTDLSIGRIAVQTGFTDLNNFNNHFKKLTGNTPRRFRKTGTI